MDEVDFRQATAADVPAIARLHGESWRNHYRGAYADEFLDGPVFDERLAVWTERFDRPSPSAVTVLAMTGDALVGFAHTFLDDDPEWGSLLDNLHVTLARKGSGVGRKLMGRTAELVLDRATSPRLYLWVLEQNVAAQGFYQRLGGEFAGTKATQAPGGKEVAAIRVVWPDSSVLL